MSTTASEASDRRPLRLPSSWSPRLFLSELLLKQWFEPVIPFTVMIALLVYFSLAIKDYGSVANALSLMRSFAEFGFVALGMAFSLISGGIDLSVGANFALCNFAALFFLFVVGFPVWLVVLATLATGAIVGACNGLLIGYLKARPFLTTLVTLIILRASVNLLNERFATVFATNSVDSDAWDFLGEGSILGIPCNTAALIAVLFVGHIFLSRSRYGWRLTAVGASRKAARHAGIQVRAHAACDLHALGGIVRRGRRFLRRATGQHGLGHGRRLGVSGADGCHHRRRVGHGRSRHSLASHDRRDHHLRGDQRPRSHRRSRLCHFRDHGGHSSRRHQRRRQVGQEPRQGRSEDLRQPRRAAAVAGAVDQTRRIALCAKRSARRRGGDRTRSGRRSGGRPSRSAGSPVRLNFATATSSAFLASGSRSAKSSRISAAVRTGCNSTETKT